MTDARRLPRQGGFLLIVGAILIVLGALLAVVATFMAITRSESAVDHLGSGQALFLAESGREQALRGLVVDNTYCSSVSYPNVSFGAGNFSASATLNISARVALGSAVVATDSVIPASSTAGFAAHGRIRIEDEEINYAALSTSCAPFADPACFTGAWRGVAGTTAAAHAINTSVSQEQCLVTSVGSVPDIGSQRTIETARRFIPAMMVYSKGTNIPYYRLWESTAWGPEGQALAVAAGTDIRFLRLVHARTRNEAVLGTQDNVGNIRVQVWNGVAWGASSSPGTVNVADYATRGFDIAYETANDRALVVYSKGIVNQASTSIWTGTNWVGSDDIILATIGRPRWIRLAANPRPTSNDIALIALGSATDVYGQLWTAGAWSTMGTATTWDPAISISTREAIGVAYETLSGEALFAWGASVNDRARYRTWTGTLSGITNITSAGLGNNLVNWIQIAADPSSNRLLFGAQSADPAVVVWPWDGSSFAAAIQLDPTTENVQERNFDLAFVTAPNTSNQAWAVWGNAATVTAKRGYLSGGVWAWWDADIIPLLNSDDTGYVRLVAHPRTGSIFAAFYDEPADFGAADYLRESHLGPGGATWPSALAQIIWTGPTAASPQYQRVDISASRYLPRIDWPEVFR